MGSVLPLSQTRQKAHQKGELQTNITDDHGCQNTHQDPSQQDPTVHEKDNSPQPGGIYSWDARVVQHLQRNLCHSSH